MLKLKNGKIFKSLNKKLKPLWVLEFRRVKSPDKPLLLIDWLLWRIIWEVEISFGSIGTITGFFFKFFGIVTRATDEGVIFFSLKLDRYKVELA